MEINCKTKSKIISNNFNKFLLISVSIFFALFGLAKSSLAATYYVDKDSTGGTCNDTNAGTNITAPWCTIDKANKTLAAGDMAYIRAGTYNIGNLAGDGGSVNSQGINPNNSGTDMDHRITYSAYPGESVNFVGIADGTATRATAIDIEGRNYIHVTGGIGYNMTFVLMTMNLKCGYNSPANYNEIDHCDFGTFYSADSANYRGSTIMRGSQYNYIHDNKFHDWQWYTADNDGPVCFELGVEEGAEADSFNVIENNQFYHCGHHAFGLEGKYNVFRNNIIHNENYYNIGGILYGYRNLLTNGIGYHLIEENRFGPSGISYLSASSVQRGGTSVYLNSPYNIIRYNAIFGALGMAMNVRSYDGRNVGYNSVYNNTFYKTGYSTENDINCDERFPIHLSDDGALNDYNKFKNNLFHSTWPQTNDNPQQSGCGTRPITPVIYGDLVNETWANNLEATGAASSHFTNPDVSNAMSSILPDLTLVSTDSTTINKASYLTAVDPSDSGSGTTLKVSDASYFQDGKFGSASGINTSSWVAMGINVAADYISVGTVGNTVKISSINYATNTITLASGISRSSQDPIWLFKDSKGNRVLYGTAPDYGAFEYQASSDITQPSAPSGLSVQ